MSSTVPPSPTFSPTTVQLLGAEPRLGLWASTRVWAMWLFHAVANDVSAAFTCSGGRPFDCRSALILVRKAPAGSLAARAGRDRTNPDPSTAAIAMKATLVRARRNTATNPLACPADEREPLRDPAALQRSLIGSAIPQRSRCRRSQAVCDQSLTVSAQVKPCDSSDPRKSTDLSLSLCLKMQKTGIEPVLCISGLLRTLRECPPAQQVACARRLPTSTRTPLHA